jgi:hypothetical protein
MPIKHHLDRRASQLKEFCEGSSDELLSTRELAAWLGVSTQFLEIGRTKNYGPRFIRQSSRRIRYMRRDVLAWLDERTFSCTSEYSA